MAKQTEKNIQSGSDATGSYRGFPKKGAPFGVPSNKDYSILGSILGFPVLGSYHRGFRVLEVQN